MPKNKYTKERIKKNIDSKKFLKKIKRKKNLSKKKKNGSRDVLLEKSIECPEVFSISENFIKTLAVLEKIRNHSMVTRKKILLNMKNVEKVDADALMYLKYIVYEAREIKKRNCIMAFIGPKDTKIRNFLYDSGFVINYKNNKKDPVDRKLNRRYWETTDDYKLGQETESFKIRSGNKIIIEEIKNIVDFSVKNVSENSKITLRNSLYTMIHELMENTISHAYLDKQNFIHKDWLLFAEKRDNIISFIFLDTGLGIPRTVVQKNLDKILEVFGSITNESDILLSTLKGEERTRTKEVNRGKGLPYVYSLFKKECIQNLRIISNKACFNLNNNIDVEKHLQGTFFYWEINLNNYKIEIEVKNEI